MACNVTTVQRASLQLQLKNGILENRVTEHALCGLIRVIKGT